MTEQEKEAVIGEGQISPDLSSQRRRSETQIRKPVRPCRTPSKETICVTTGVSEGKERDRKCI